MRKNLLYIIIVIQVLVIGSLIKGIWSSFGVEKRVDELALKKDKLVQENIEITEKIAESKSEYYMEKVAREQLHLVKDGETVVIVKAPKDNNEINYEKEELTNKQNWQKWLEVLLPKR